MVLAVFKRMAIDALGVLGEPSTLDGFGCGRVNLQRDVQVDAGIAGTANDNPTVNYDVATFAGDIDARVGQVLVHPDGSFRLDALLKKSPYRRSFVVLEMP